MKPPAWTVIAAWVMGCLGSLALVPCLNAAIITVNTTNNVNPAAGEVSLAQALANLHDGDTIQFAIPGTGPFYLATPPNGYPLITNHNLTIDGYSQPGAGSNTNPILAPNNARLQIVLDSRGGGHTAMVVPLLGANDDPGYDPTGESALLGIIGGTNFTARGLCFLGPGPNVGDTNNQTNLYFIAFARGASGGHISGCWMGVAPDGNTLAGCADGVAGFHYQQKDFAGKATNLILIDDTVIGVAPRSTNAPAEFNVIVEATLPIILEGARTRIAGNFLTVLPDGLHDDNVAFKTNLFTLPGYQFQGAVEIGLDGNNTVIGTDGDGVNDENERNVIGGTVPFEMNGYYHTLEFYANNPGTNIVIAGNYIGVGIDGKTQFTNGVPPLNAAGSQAQYRLGSDFDGVSDALEGNVIYNYYPPSLFPASAWDYNNTNSTIGPDELNFFDELSVGGTVSLRGNVLVDNFPFPTSPASLDGVTPAPFLTNYYTQALAATTNGLVPTLSTNSSLALLTGTVPLANNHYPTTIIDLYVADPVGLTNGQAGNIPLLPSGFVQGKVYLGSFVVGSTNDLSTRPGTFQFSLANLPLTPGVLVAATANYSVAPAGTHNALTLTSPFSDPVNLLAPATNRPITLTAFSLGGSGLTLSWSGGAGPFRIQMKTNLTDTAWQDVVAVTNSTTAIVGVTNRAGFYRVQGQ